MDSLFAGPASERRRFLDRLVLALDPNHGARVSQFERALRGRNRLLEEGARNAPWLDAIEREAAELGVAVAAARVECATRLKALIALHREEASPFPWADLSLEGEVEALAAQIRRSPPRTSIAPRCATIAHRDAAAGRTLIGPHVGDLLVFHGPNGAPAAQSSTGEQKALLVGLVLAHARLVAEMSGLAPLALLDEVAAHFDPRRRAALFDALERVGAQVFVTGADPAVSPGSASGRGCSKSFPGGSDPGRASQAWPASEDSQASVTPSSASARSYLSSQLASKISRESAGETSQPLARISLSSWPDPQPA